MTKEKEDISLIESGINSEITLESIIKFLYKNIKILFFTPVCVSIISVVYAQFFSIMFMFHLQKLCLHHQVAALEVLATLQLNLD